RWRRAGQGPRRSRPNTVSADANVFWDPVARAAVPDCTTVPNGILRLNCTRARSGWPGDLIPLARAYLRGDAVPRGDEKLAVRLLELAVSRGHPRAKWELSILLRNGGIAWPGSLGQKPPRPRARVPDL